MRKYFGLQWKRVSRYLIGAIAVVLILMGGLLLAFSAMTSMASDSQENQKVQVGICGDVEDPIMQMGLTAITALDSSRFTMEVQILPEAEASGMLEAGDLAAYVVIPEGFMEEALCGNLIPIKMVTTSGSASVVSIFKDEVTKVIAGIVVDAQKGVFGMMDGFQQYDVPYQQPIVDELCFEYVEFILCRGETYALEELGIADELRFTEYLLCGLAVLLILLACLPFAPLMIRQDNALGRMLAAKGKPLWKQCACKFGAYFLGLVIMMMVMLLLAVIAMGILAPDMLEDFPVFSIILNTVPVIFMAAAMSYLLYSLSGDLISGVLLQFFSVVAMCFVSGCMYPVYFFPQSVQKMAAWLPTGVARGQLAGVFSGSFSWGCFGGLMAFGMVFLAIGTAVRVISTKNGGR